MWLGAYSLNWLANIGVHFTQNYWVFYYWYYGYYTGIMLAIRGNGSLGSLSCYVVV